MLASKTQQRCNILSFNILTKQIAVLVAAVVVPARQVSDSFDSGLMSIFVLLHSVDISLY